MDIFKLALFALVLAAISCVVSAVCPDILDKEMPLWADLLVVIPAIGVIGYAISRRNSHN